MVKKSEIKLFEGIGVRSVWDSDKEEWYFSVVDVVGILTESIDPKRYWSVLKSRLKKEGSEPTTICSKLKLKATDGKMRLTDVATSAQILRIIQSIPSPKAEPFKQWMAQVAAMRIDQMQDPELSIDQAISDYRRLGYSEAWINQRIKGIEVRKGLTDEWKRSGIVENKLYAALTSIMTKEWSGLTVKEYKQLKGLKKENLRDNMTNMELALNMLAEASATDFSKKKNPKGFKQSASIAKDGGKVAKAARNEYEKQLGSSVITDKRASDYISQKDDEQEKLE